MTISIVAMADVICAGRFLNLVLGLWIAVASWILNEVSISARWNGVVAGLLIAVLAVPRGPIRERYAAWDRRIV